MSYKSQDTLEQCQGALQDAATFYQQSFVNYRGKTSDTNEYYTEIVARFLCDHLQVYQNSIPVVSRTRGYHTLSHDGVYSDTSNRTEEIIAMQLFNQSRDQGPFPFIGHVIDYQTPLKADRDDIAGKIDLLAFDGETLRVLELKKPDSTETMLRCVLEGFTYRKTADTQVLLHDFKLPATAHIKASPFVFRGMSQHQELLDGRPWLEKLMLLLDSKPYYIEKKNDQYVVTEK